MEQAKPSTLADAQIERMDAVTMEFFQHQRTLAAELKNLQSILEKQGQAATILSGLEEYLKNADQVCYLCDV